MKKNAIHITDFSSKNIPVLNRQLKDIWNTLGKVDYEEVSSASTAPNGGSHGDIKLLNDSINKVLWINIEGTWSNIGNLISSLIDHTHSSTSGQGGQLDWDSIWSDAVHTHQSNAEGGTIKLDDWATPDDNTDLNVSTTAHGLTPKLPNDNTKFLDGTGSYDVPVHSELSGTHNLTTDIDHDSITNTHSKLFFKTIAVSGQNNVVADSDTDTLTLVAGSNVTITTDDTADSVTIASSGGSGTLTTIKEATVQVGDADIVTLDFDGTDFNLSESPDTEINISIEDSGIDHGAIGGLADDDHTQYLLADGTRKVSGSFSPSTDNTVDLGAVGATDYRWKDLKLSGNLDDETNQVSVAQCKTAYDHSQDNTQAHSDYLLNNGDDSSTGRITAAGLTTSQNLIIGSNWITNDGDNEGIQVGVTGFVGVNTVPTYNLDVDGSAQTVLNVKGDGDTYAYATIYLMSDETTDKVWALSHRQDITNKFTLSFYNGSVWIVPFGVTSGGVVQIGDGGSSNYTEFEADGTMKFNGTATVFGVISIPVNSMIRSTSAPPALTGYKAGYSFGYDSAAEEIAAFRVEIPPDYKEGSDITFYVHWTPTDTNSGNVVWRIDYSWANVDDAFPVDTEVNITVAADGVSDKHQRDVFSAISGTGKTIGSVLLCSIMRDADEVGDTYASDALLHCVSVHYEKDTVGSRTITTK